MKSIYISVLLLLIVISSNAQKSKSIIRNDFRKFYDKYNLDGSFVIYNQNNNQYIFYNKSQFTKAFIPASTFKICNSLIGLETGVISDENFVIPWDSVVRQNPAWNEDSDLKAAFKNSTVWYYQELARRVGGERMNAWIKKANYGNSDTTGGIDQFWLSGGLRITPEQQIDFLKRLHENNLPFSLRTMSITKKIMIADKTSSYTLYAKAGWGRDGKTDIGWYVGYIETNNNVYYFSNCIQTNNSNNSDFAHARKDISYQILSSLKLIP
jgi:beta-lactamase class D